MNQVVTSDTYRAQPGRLNFSGLKNFEQKKISKAEFLNIIKETGAEVYNLDQIKNFISDLHKSFEKAQKEEGFNRDEWDRHIFDSNNKLSEMIPVKIFEKGETIEAFLSFPDEYLYKSTEVFTLEGEEIIEKSDLTYAFGRDSHDISFDKKGSEVVKKTKERADDIQAMANECLTKMNNIKKEIGVEPNSEISSYSIPDF